MYVKWYTIEMGQCLSATTDDHRTVIIVACSIIAGVLLLLLAAMTAAVCVCFRRRSMSSRTMNGEMSYEYNCSSLWIECILVNYS